MADNAHMVAIADTFVDADKMMDHVVVVDDFDFDLNFGNYFCGSF